MESEVLDTCQKVMFTAFKNATLHDDLSGLIKSGTPTPTELETAWEKVFNEYLTISGDTHIQQILILMKDIAILTNKITLIELIVEQMRISYVGAFADQLRSLGFRFQYEDGPELLRELELTLNQTIQLRLRLQESQAEYQQLQVSDGAQVTDQDYEVYLSELEKFQGVAMNPDTTSVARYCAIVKRFKIHCENGSR